MLEQTLLFIPLALGIYVSFAVLRIPDLTTDGSFVLGAAIYAVSLQYGINPCIALILATLSGAIAGMAASFLQTWFRLNPLIAGILLVFILNSFTLKFMGKPNLSLFNYPSLFGSEKMKILVGMTLVLIGGLAFILKSRLGLMLYAFGNNPTLLTLCGKNANVFRMTGLMLSNGCVRCCGALTAQASGFADIGMGTGIVLIALGTVIIGQRLYDFMVKWNPHFKLLQLLFCCLGVAIYFAMVTVLIRMGVDPIYLRMMMGLCLTGFLAMTREKQVGVSFA